MPEIGEKKRLGGAEMKGREIKRESEEMDERRACEGECYGFLALSECVK